MLRRSVPILSLVTFLGFAVSAQAAIGNGREPIVIEPWLPMVAEAPVVAPRQCRMTQHQVRQMDRSGQLRLRTVQRSTCRA